MRSSTLSVCALQADSPPSTVSARRTEPSFPPPSLSFLLPEELWPRVRALLNADRDITLADIFGPAVEAWLDDLNDPDGTDPEPTRFSITAASLNLKAPKKPLDRPLTERQAEVLAFLRERIGRFGQSPTIREIVSEFGFSGTNAAVGHLDALERRGLIRRDPLARGIRLVDGSAAA